MDGLGLGGPGLYAAAGLLEDKTTTTHWGFRHNLRALGIEVVADRVVRQGNHISGAGVPAGIDIALALLAVSADRASARARDPRRTDAAVGRPEAAA